MGTVLYLSTAVKGGVGKTTIAKSLFDSLVRFFGSSLIKNSVPVYGLDLNEGNPNFFRNVNVQLRNNPTTVSRNTVWKPQALQETLTYYRLPLDPRRGHIFRRYDPYKPFNGTYGFWKHVAAITADVVNDNSEKNHVIVDTNKQIANLVDISDNTHEETVPIWKYFGKNDVEINLLCVWTVDAFQDPDMLSAIKLSIETIGKYVPTTIYHVFNPTEFPYPKTFTGAIGTLINPKSRKVPIDSMLKLVKQETRDSLALEEGIKVISGLMSISSSGENLYEAYNNMARGIRTKYVGRPRNIICIPYFFAALVGVFKGNYIASSNDIDQTFIDLGDLLLAQLRATYGAPAIQ